MTSLPVKEAEHNETPFQGPSISAPARTTCGFRSAGKISLDPGPRIEGYRPCADVALETLPPYARAMTVGVVLTGMGNDAAKGVQAGEGRRRLRSGAGRSDFGDFRHAR